jgi:nicotinate phosphoribosyltransferase
MVQTATWEEIITGKITDVYFQRALEILKTKGIDRWVKAEFIAKSLPNNWPWAVLAGIEECAQLLQQTNVNVRAMAEGTLFRPYEPVLEIEGYYSHFCLFETALLGFLCQASGIATKAARCKKLANPRRVISFGARRMHPSLAPMIERNAFIGGCDGVAVIASAELIAQDPIGTMPHSLILIIGDTVEAVKAFHEVIPGEIPRVALIDTFNDEKIEALRVAEALGKNLDAIRLDTPRSRRGNFYAILEEIRWELDIRGYNQVKIYVSGGIDEEDILQLNPLVEAYGVGTAISNAPVIDFAMDIVEIEGRPNAKRGKWSGAKRVMRCPQCFRDNIIPFTPLQTYSTSNICSCGGTLQDLLELLIKEGQLVSPLPSPTAIREMVLAQLERVEL